MVFLLNGSLDKPPTRLATSAKNVLKAHTYHDTKDGGLQLSRAYLLRSTFNLISPAMPKYLASQIHAPQDEGRVRGEAAASRQALPSQASSRPSRSCGGVRRGPWSPLSRCWKGGCETRLFGGYVVLKALNKFLLL